MELISVHETNLSIRTITDLELQFAPFVNFMAANTHTKVNATLF